MSKKNFYSHLIEIETLTTELDQLEMSDGEKAHLATLIDSSLHHTVLDAILSELSEEDKKVFMKHLSSEDHGKVWELLNEKVEDVEGKIKKSADELKTQLHKDVREAKIHVKKGDK